MIHNDKIRAVIAAGINAKKKNPATDLTPAAYMRIEDYIESLETLVVLSGKELPTVF